MRNHLFKKKKTQNIEEASIDKKEEFNLEEAFENRRKSRESRVSKEEKEIISTILKDLKSAEEDLSKIYPEAKRNGFVGPINIGIYKLVLSFWEGKTPAWFVIRRNIRADHHYFEMAFPEEIQLMNQMKLIDEKITSIELYVNRIDKILIDAGQMEMN